MQTAQQPPINVIPHATPRLWYNGCDQRMPANATKHLKKPFPLNNEAEYWGYDIVM
jgi:hypothetical protein